MQQILDSQPRARSGRIIHAAPIDEARLRDPDDAAVLACARAAGAEMIVSGDDDLQALGEYEGIPIVNPAEALRRVGQTT